MNQIQFKGIKLGSIIQPESNYNTITLAPDCISCTKNKTGKLPAGHNNVANPQCLATCKPNKIKRHDSNKTTSH